MCKKIRGIYSSDFFYREYILAKIEQTVNC